MRALQHQSAFAGEHREVLGFGVRSASRKLDQEMDARVKRLLRLFIVQRRRRADDRSVRTAESLLQMRIRVPDSMQLGKRFGFPSIGPTNGQKFGTALEAARM